MKSQSHLPIFKNKNEIIAKIQKSQCTIIVSETGSGKTTQIPQFLYEKGLSSNGIIAITQPRRVAAVTVASRVASEMKSALGEKVGYKIRFEDTTSSQTKIQFMTDGMLVRDYMADSSLKKYSVVIIDEAHERTLNTEILFALIKKLMEKRKDLKIIIMSATLSIDKFANFFTNSQIISAEGRIFNVKEKFLETRETDPVDAAIITILQIHTENNINDDQKFTKNGHILVFFSGQDEIERAKAILKKKITQFPNFCANLRIYPIFSALPTKKQIKVFEKVPKNIRKVILATNIAETSITIDEVEFVVDCGYSKKRFYDFKSGVDVMVNGLITKSEANQRKGRAGRVTNGVCYRLYTEEVYEQMREDIVPEILRTNLSTIIILLKSLGIKKMSELEFIDSPDKDSMNRSCKNLMYLGAISKNGKLSDLGQKISILPLNVMSAIALVNSQKYGVLEKVLTAVSMMELENVWITNNNNYKKLQRAKNHFSRNGKIGLKYRFFKIFAI